MCGPFVPFPSQSTSTQAPKHRHPPKPFSTCSIPLSLTLSRFLTTTNPPISPSSVLLVSLHFFNCSSIFPPPLGLSLLYLLWPTPHSLKALLPNSRGPRSLPEPFFAAPRHSFSGPLSTPSQTQTKPHFFLSHHSFFSRSLTLWPCCRPFLFLLLAESPRADSRCG
jgi:hypothetical protein